MGIKIDHYNFFGLKVSNVSKNELQAYYDDTILASDSIVCYGYSFGIIPAFKKHPDLIENINAYDINVTDGTLFYWFMNILGYKVKEFISIPTMTIDILKYANKNHKSVLLIGADQETNKRATNNLRILYPGVHFFDGLHGYYKEEEERDIVRYINRCSPTILLIGISTPIKERFASKYKELLGANIIVPCGGMIDVFSGKVKLAPPIIKRLGLATLVRVLQEPKRHLKPNICFAYETFVRIIPTTIWEVLIKRNKKFNIPSIYKIEA